MNKDFKYKNTIGIESTYPKDMPNDHSSIPVWNSENWFYEDVIIDHKIRSLRRTISEGEIVFIIYKGKFVGISVGNEVAGNLRSNSQFWVSPSKVFTGCASIGPCILSMEDEEENKKPLELKLEINHYRKNQKVGSGSIITEFKTSPLEIVEATVIHDSPPDLLLQFSGGFAISRKDDEIIPLEKEDSIKISLEGVGFIQNEVEIV